MATTPKAPAKPAVGPNFPKSQESTSVRPARDRGEANPLPVMHCGAKRAASNVKATY